ncbi:MAG: hypothetical protein FE78DRAFT_429353 [Acidomyces sp. 'richmondensis']|nr:MAG: hypothetical protein FE78DRAFT_429353 [Acidomyces sp. 'richmondensis']
MFMNFKVVRCNDDQDHIYVILNIRPSNLSLDPDYRLAVTQVHEKSCLAVMKWSDSLELLRLCYQPLADKTLPSWIYDFSWVLTYIALALADESNSCNACYSSSCCLSQPHSGALNVRMPFLCKKITVMK